MPCLILILFVAFPRITLLVLFFVSNYLERAYHGLLLPLLGFIFLPLTTLAYAWLTNTHQPIAGFNLIILIVAVVIDIGGIGGGEYHRRRRWVRVDGHDPKSQRRLQGVVRKRKEPCRTLQDPNGSREALEASGVLQAPKRKVSLPGHPTVRQTGVPSQDRGKNGSVFQPSRMEDTKLTRLADVPASWGDGTGEILRVETSGNKLMKARAVLGLILIVAGVFVLAYQEFSYTTHKKAVDIGSLQVEKKEHHFVSLPPILGAVALIAGIAVLLTDRRGGDTIVGSR